MRNRVVVTGMGVVAANAVGTAATSAATLTVLAVRAPATIKAGLLQTAAAAAAPATTQ